MYDHQKKIKAGSEPARFPERTGCEIYWCLDNVIQYSIQNIQTLYRFVMKRMSCIQIFYNNIIIDRTNRSVCICFNSTNKDEHVLDAR